MSVAELKLRLTIPEQSDDPSPPAAIGLADAVRQEGAENPFDLGRALARAASSYSGRPSSTLQQLPAEVKQ